MSNIHENDCSNECQQTPDILELRKQNTAEIRQQSNQILELVGDEDPKKAALNEISINKKKDADYAKRKLRSDRRKKKHVDKVKSTGSEHSISTEEKGRAKTSSPNDFETSSLPVVKKQSILERAAERTQMKLFNSSLPTPSLTPELDELPNIDESHPPQVQADTKIGTKDPGAIAIRGPDYRHRAIPPSASHRQSRAQKSSDSLAPARDGSNRSHILKDAPIITATCVPSEESMEQRVRDRILNEAVVAEVLVEDEHDAIQTKRQTETKPLCNKRFCILLSVGLCVVASLVIGASVATTVTLLSIDDEGNNGEQSDTGFDPDSGGEPDPCGEPELGPVDLNNCVDDPTWSSRLPNGRYVDCKFVSRDPNPRCALTGGDCRSATGACCWACLPWRNDGEN